MSIDTPLQTIVRSTLHTSLGISTVRFSAVRNLTTEFVIGSYGGGADFPTEHLRKELRDNLPLMSLPSTSNIDKLIENTVNNLETALAFPFMVIKTIERIMPAFPYYYIMEDLTNTVLKSTSATIETNLREQANRLKQPTTDMILESLPQLISELTPLVAATQPTPAAPTPALKKVKIKVPKAPAPAPAPAPAAPPSPTSAARSALTAVILKSRKTPVITAATSVAESSATATAVTTSSWLSLATSRVYTPPAPPAELVDKAFHNGLVICSSSNRIS